MGIGLLHAAVIFWLPIYAINDSCIVSEDGQMSNMWLMSLTSFMSLFLIQNNKLLVESRSISLFQAGVFLILSIIPYFLFIWGSNWLGDELKSEIVFSHITARFYLTVFLSVCICFLIDYTVRVCQILIWPDPSSYLISKTV